MSWVRLDDAFGQHPKVAALSDRAFRTHVLGLCYAAHTLTDGAVPDAIVRGLHPQGRQAAKELVAAGVWEDNGNGYQIHDYLDFQPSALEVREGKTRRSAAARKGALARWRK